MALEKEGVGTFKFKGGSLPTGNVAAFSLKFSHQQTKCSKTSQHTPRRRCFSGGAIALTGVLVGMSFVLRLTLSTGLRSGLMRLAAAAS